jgi:proton-dependent oligopeptide transporter, POT family
MGLWLATSFAGNFIAGWIGSLWTAMDKAAFFLMVAAVAGIAGVAIWAFGRPLGSILGVEFPKNERYL